MSKFLVVSNIHGRYYELLEVLSQVKKDHAFNEFTNIVFLGDYIGFGYKNKEVMRFLMDFKQAKTNVVLLKGEWEDALLHVQRNRNSALEKHFFDTHFKQFKQIDMLNDLRADKALLNEWVDTIEQMDVACTIDNYFFSHAGLQMDDWGNVDDATFFSQIHETNYTQMMDNGESYSRYYQSTPRRNFPQRIVMGQVPIHKFHGTEEATKYDKPFRMGGLCAVDFGARYNDGRLGAVVLDEGKIKSYTFDVFSKEAVMKISKKPLYESSKQTPKQPSSDEQKKKEEQKKNAYQNTLTETWELYEKGVNIADISRIRGLKEATIESHLIELYKQGKAIRLETFYDKNNISVVMKAILKHGAEDIIAIKKNVPKNISYTEIKAIGVLKKVM